MKRILLAFLIGFLPFSHADLSKKEIKEWENKVFPYINGIKTLKATFIQETSRQEPVKGTFWLNKQSKEKYGKMRLAYLPPSKITYWADGKHLYQYDKAVDEVTTHPLENTPAFFLLQKDIKMTRDFYIKEADIRQNLLGITFVQRGYEDTMEFTVFFKVKPFLLLHGWIVKDNQNNFTQVLLQDIQINIPLQDKLFTGK